MFFCYILVLHLFFFKQKTAYEMRISDWSSDVCSSDLFVLIDEVCRFRLADGDFLRLHRLWYFTKQVDDEQSVTQIRLLHPDKIGQFKASLKSTIGNAHMKEIGAVLLTLLDRKSTRLNSSH